MCFFDGTTFNYDAAAATFRRGRRQHARGDDGRGEARAQRAEQTGVVLGDRDRGRPSDDVGDRQRDGRSRGGGEHAATDDHEIRRGQRRLGRRRLDQDAESGARSSEPEPGATAASSPPVAAQPTSEEG